MKKNRPCILKLKNARNLYENARYVLKLNEYFVKLMCVPLYDNCYDESFNKKGL